MRTRFLAAIASTLLLVTACAELEAQVPTGATQPKVPGAASDSTTTTTIQEDTAAPALADVPEKCPVTIPERLFTPPAPYPPDPVHDDAVWYGTPELWTAINPKDPVRSESWLRGEKTFWWSENFPGGAMEGSPNITVTAGHLDGSAPVVKSGGPGTNGFHPDMGDFMLVGVELPAPGCWELTAEYKGASLSYVMWVPDR
jgi:hypothetical protein